MPISEIASRANVSTDFAVSELSRLYGHPLSPSFVISEDTAGIAILLLALLRVK